MPRKDVEERRKYHREYKERIGKDVIKRKHRAWRLPKVYGISLEDFEELSVIQNNSCAICHRHKDEFKRGYELHVDHCHNTGKVRGLLCYQCNVFLGKIENIEYMNSVNLYLDNNDKAVYH